MDTSTLRPLRSDALRSGGEREGVRDATLADVDPLVDLERACFPPSQAYGREQYVHALGPAKAVNLVLEEAGTLVAYVGAFVDVPQNVDEKPRPAGRGGLHHRAHRVGHVITLNVHPKERRRGHGARLMAACERALAALGMERVVLEVNVENAPAIRLYEKLGYERVGEIAEYYEGYPNNDAFAYEKDLTPVLRS